MANIVSPHPSLSRSEYKIRMWSICFTTGKLEPWVNDLIYYRLDNRKSRCTYHFTYVYMISFYISRGSLTRSTSDMNLKKLDKWYEPNIISIPYPHHMENIYVYFMLPQWYATMQIVIKWSCITKKYAISFTSLALLHSLSGWR